MALMKMKWPNSSTFIYLDHQGHLACDLKHDREKLNLSGKLLLEHPTQIFRDLCRDRCPRNYI